MQHCKAFGLQAHCGHNRANCNPRHNIMLVERITTWPELVKLEPRWNSLASGIPFRTWDWLAIWWKYYGECATSKELSILAVFDDGARDANGTHSGQLIGVAPWYIDRSPIMGSTLRWLGDGETCTDHISILCEPEDYVRVAVALADVLTVEHDDWDRLQLSAVDRNDAAVALLLGALEERDCVVAQREAGACWVLDLPQTWDDFLASLSKSHRKQLRQLERRVLESSRVEWHRVRSGSDLDKAWHVLVELHQRRRRSLGEAGCFASRPFSQFHRDAVERLLSRRELRMSWLALDGKPAAAEYHLAGGGTTFAYQGGVDPERLAEEPGRLSTILCLREAIEAGHAQFDFLRGDEPYKAHWRATPQPTCDFGIVPNRRFARLRGKVVNIAGRLSDWARDSS
jgi:CelD/BcsL family acetyltransferase involved in cellulose biosynthesis